MIATPTKAEPEPYHSMESGLSGQPYSARCRWYKSCNIVQINWLFVLMKNSPSRWPEEEDGRKVHATIQESFERTESEHQALESATKAVRTPKRPAD